MESLVQGLIDKTFDAVKAALKDAKIDASKVDEVVLVGGMTRMPAVQSAVEKFFGKEPHKGINPDEVVAIGAAIQGGVLGGEVKDVLLLDVTPLTLGIETMGAVSTPLINRNSTIPTSKSETFSTASDNQTSVEINVLQGERGMAADNKSLGRFILDGIPPAPRGVPQVEVTFDIDASGILHVSAKEKTTGKEQKITITGSTGLDKDEVERMTKEAEAHAEEDKKKKEEIETRNMADQIVYTAEKSLKDAEGKIGDDLKKEVEEKIQAVKDAKEGPVDELKTKADALGESMQKIGAEMYKQQAADANAQQDTSNNNQDTNNGESKAEEATDAKDEAVEGEVVEEKKD
jgi:molecular chaperone DnaK